MSPVVYQRTLRPCRRYVRSSSNSRSSSADVRFCADFVRFTPKSRPSWWCRRRSVVDPFQILPTLREKLIKIGAKVVRNGRYITFPMAEVAIPRTPFIEIRRLIDRLRPAPLPP